MNFQDAILKRISTRTFQPQKLKEEDISFIKTTLSKYKNVNGPFGHSFEFTFHINDKTEEEGIKVGTYGLLKNVPAFFGGVCENNKESLIDFGYVFEFLIIEFTKHQLDTCWLGGTFKRSQFPQDVKEGEIIPAISPVGYRKDKRSIVDRMLRSAAQSNNRLPFDTLFVDTDLSPLDKNTLGDITDCLRMVQKGPSASNKQPWRMIIDHENKQYHMYIEHTKNYARVLNYKIQHLDIGIALAHFEMGLIHFNKEYERVIIDNPPVTTNWEYIITLQVTS